MLTGYQPVLGNTFCLVSRAGDSVEVRLVAPADEEDRIPRDCATEIRTYVEETLDKISTTVPAARKPLAEEITSARLGGGAVIAYEGDRSPVAPAYTQVGFPGVSTIDLLHDVLPAAELQPATQMLDELASVKTAAELEHIRQAESVALAGFHAARAAIQPGATEADVAAAAQSAIIRAGYTSAPAGHVLVYVHVMAGARAADAYKAYNLTGGNQIERGATVSVQMEVGIDGYWAELTRSFFVGSVDEAWSRVHGACVRAQDAALAIIRDGVAGQEVDEAARSVLRGAGFGKEFKHGLGHGFGFQAINHAAEPILHPVSQSILRAGMVHNMEPAVYRPGVGGFRLNDNVAVRPDGYELLSSGLPRELDWLVVDW
jgi:Xaa-Pro aminopeptidase